MMCEGFVATNSYHTSPPLTPVQAASAEGVAPVKETFVKSTQSESGFTVSATAPEHSLLSTGVIHEMFAIHPVLGASPDVNLKVMQPPGVDETIVVGAIAEYVPIKGADVSEPS